MTWSIIQLGISCELLLLILNGVRTFEKRENDAYIASIYLYLSCIPEERIHSNSSKRQIKKIP
jgi:hypothetical protein